jgi:transposase-like protein
MVGALSMLTPTRTGERNGHYQRNLVTPAGEIERLEVPRDREGEFVTEVLERHKRLTGNVEEAVLETYLSGISTRKIAKITEAVSRVKAGKDAVSRTSKRLEGEQRQHPYETLLIAVCNDIEPPILRVPDTAVPEVPMPSLLISNVDVIRLGQPQ